MHLTIFMYILPWLSYHGLFMPKIRRLIGILRIRIRGDYIMKKISSYIIRYWYAYAFAIICMVISIGLDMISPQITRLIIDDVIVGGNIGLLNKLLIGILIVGAGRCIFQYFKEITFDYTSSKIACEIRQHLFKHIQGLSVSFFDKTNTGELMSRVKDDVDRIWSYYSRLI